MQHHLRYRLPDSFITLFSQFDGLNLEWKTSAQRGGLHGSIGIVSLGRIVGKYSDLSRRILNPEDYFGDLWTDEEDPGHEQLKTLRPLERWPGDSRYTALRFNRGRIEIFLVEVRCGILKLPLTFEQYLDRLLAWLGADNWVDFVLDEDARQGVNEPIGKALRQIESILAKP